MSDPTRRALPIDWFKAYRHHRNLSAEARFPVQQQLREIKRDINTKSLTRGAC